MKEIVRLNTLNARIFVHAGMTKSQLAAAYEEKGKLAMEASRVCKKDLMPCVSDWQEMTAADLAQCCGLEASAVSKPNRRALEAGDYVDPLNQLQTLSGTLVLQRTLPLFAYDYPELLNMFTDFSSEPGEYNQETVSRIVAIPGVQKYDPSLDANGRPKGFVVVSAPQTTDVPLTLTDYISVPIVIGAATIDATQRDLFKEQAPAAAKAIAGYFVGMVSALLTPQVFSAYAAVTNDNPQTVPVAYASYARNLQDWAMTDLDKLSAIFTQCKVPRNERGILLSPAYYAKLRSDPRLEFFFAASQGNPMLQQQTLPQGLSGFFPYEAPYLPTGLPFFAFHKAGIVLKSRLPTDFVKALSLSPGQIPGSVTVIADADTKMSVALVQRVDLVSNYAEWRPEVILGVGPGDKRGGLCGGL
jgi:hypothetical protein